MATPATTPDPQLEEILVTLRALLDVQTAVTADEVHELPPLPTNGELFGDLLRSIGVVVASFTALVAVTSQFVQAFDPGLITQFHRVLQDVSATIGVAFTGIFDQGISFLRQLAGEIQPIFAALKPVVDQLTNTILKLITQLVTAFAPVFSALVPALMAVAQLFELVSAVMRPVIALFAALLLAAAAPVKLAFQLLSLALAPLIALVTAFGDGLTQLTNTFSIILDVFVNSLGGMLASLFNSVGETVKKVVDYFNSLQKAIIVTTARIALLAGATDFVSKLRDSFNKTGENAVGQTSISSLEQIAKDMALASVNAAGASDAKDATNADIVKTLDDMIKANARNADTIASAIVRSVGGDKAAEVTKVLMDPVGYAGDRVGDAIKKQVDKPGVFGFTSVVPW